MGALLTGKSIVKHFTSGHGKKRAVVHAVDGVSFDVERGETLCLVGESGSGKTTVGRLILGLDRPTRGVVEFDGKPIVTPQSTYERRDMRRRIQAVFQDPYGSLNPRMRVGSVLAEAARQLDEVEGSGDGLRSRILEVLDMVGLATSVQAKYPHELSAGNQQKVGIARAFASRPDLIVLDEPTSALSPRDREELVNVLRSVQKETGASYVFISHDLSVVRELATNVAVMYLGRIVTYGGAREVFDSPVHPYAEALLSSVLRADFDQRGTLKVLKGEIPSPIDIPPGCTFASRCDWANDSCRVDEPELVEIAHGAGEGMWVRCARSLERGEHLRRSRIS